MSNGLLSVDEALERLLAGARPVAETETVDTIAATGRVLAKAQASTLDVPPLMRNDVGAPVGCTPFFCAQKRE